MGQPDALFPHRGLPAAMNTAMQRYSTGCHSERARHAAKAGDAVQAKRLIGTGTDFNENNIAYKTALCWAADAGHIDVVQMLMAKRAYVNVKDVTDQTPLMFAVLGQHESILELLIAKGGDVNLADLCLPQTQSGAAGGRAPRQWR